MIFLAGMDIKHGNGPLLSFSKALTNGKTNMQDKNTVGSTLPKLVGEIFKYIKPSPSCRHVKFGCMQYMT